MKIETAAGAVIFRREAGRIVFLLIYSQRNALWGFPKGHREPGENETETAHREIREETGLSGLRFIDGFREEDVYRITGRNGEPVEKHSLYFLAETSESAVIVDQEEISDFRWLPADEALNLLRFDGSKAILRKAELFITTILNSQG